MITKIEKNLYSKLTNKCRSKLYRFFWNRLVWICMYAVYKLSKHDNELSLWLESDICLTYRNVINSELYTTFWHRGSSIEEQQVIDGYVEGTIRCLKILENIVNNNSFKCNKTHARELLKNINIEPKDKEYYE